MVSKGETVKLICPINGNPAPSITWFKGNEEIHEYSWIRFRKDKKSVTITNAEYDDTGIYICKGVNGYGSDEVRIDLFVISKLKRFILGGQSKKDTHRKIIY